MKPVYKNLIALLLLVLIILAMYGFVNLLDMLKNFSDDSWIAPLFILSFLAIIPMTIFSMTNQGMESMEKLYRDEEEAADSSL